MISFLLILKKMDEIFKDVKVLFHLRVDKLQMSINKKIDGSPRKPI